MSSAGGRRVLKPAPFLPRTWNLRRVLWETFRPSVVGIYYQCHFGGDEVVKRNIKSYGGDVNSMALFKKKELYECNILERYRINIEKTNRLYSQGKLRQNTWEGRKFCELVAESDFYRFYSYLSYSDNSGGYILRQDKNAIRNVVYFGKSQKYNCVFHNHLFKLMVFKS